MEATLSRSELCGSWEVVDTDIPDYDGEEFYHFFPDGTCVFEIFRGSRWANVTWYEYAIRPGGIAVIPLTKFSRWVFKEPAPIVIEIAGSEMVVIPEHGRRSRIARVDRRPPDRCDCVIYTLSDAKTGTHCRIKRIDIDDPSNVARCVLRAERDADA